MPRILVVDDNESLRELIEEVLQRQGYSIVQAENGAAAMKILCNDAQFDAIVSDISMPDLDGLRLTRLVRHQYPHIPVIIASAYYYQIKHARALGAVQHLHKPFSNAQLVEVVDAVVQRPALAAR